MASPQISPQPPERKRKGRSLSQSRTDINHDYDRDAFAFNHYSGFLKQPLKRHLSSDITYFMPTKDLSPTKNYFLSSEYIYRPSWASHENISTYNNKALRNDHSKETAINLNQFKNYSKKRSHSAERKMSLSSRENIKKQLHEQQVQVQHHIKQLQEQLELIKNIRLLPTYKNAQSEFLSSSSPRENRSNTSKLIQTDSLPYNDKQEECTHLSISPAEERNLPSNETLKMTDFSSENKCSKQNESHEGYVFFADEENSENETVLELQMNEIENDSSWDDDSHYIDDDYDDENWHFIREKELEKAEEELLRQRKEFANQQHLLKQQQEELENQKKKLELEKDKFNEMISINPSIQSTNITPKSNYPIPPFRRRSVTPIQSKLRPLPLNQCAMLEKLAFPQNNTFIAWSPNSNNKSSFQRPSTPTPSRNFNSFIKSKSPNSSSSNLYLQSNINHNIRLATKLNRTPTPQTLRPAASTGLLNTFNCSDKNRTQNSPIRLSNFPSHSKLNETNSFLLFPKQPIIPKIIETPFIKSTSPSPLNQEFSSNSNLISNPSNTSVSSSQTYKCEQVPFSNKRLLSPSFSQESSHFLSFSKNNQQSFKPIVPERNRRSKSPTFARNLSPTTQKESSIISTLSSKNYNQINEQVHSFQNQKIISPLRVQTRQVPQRPPSPKPFKKIPQRPPSPRKLTDMSGKLSPKYEAHSSSLLQVPKIPPRSLSASSVQMKLPNKQISENKISTNPQDSFKTMFSNSETFMDHFSQYASPHVKCIRYDELEKQTNSEKQRKLIKPKNETLERSSKTLNVNDINQDNPLTERRKTLPDALKALNVEPVILDKNCKKKHSLQTSEIHANPLPLPPHGWDREKVSEMAHQAREAKMNEAKFDNKTEETSNSKND